MATRRALLLAGPALLAGCAPAVPQAFPDLAAARAAVQGLGDAARSTGVFTLAQTLEHLAQSVEYSMAGFPAPRSALFQATLGRAAFAVFEARGAMTHGLAEPIPGAPPLTLALPAARQRLLAALQAFEAWGGPLAPHFAYGALDKAQYTRAHLMHLGNHWAEVARA